jgi:hypothetical protein
VKLPKNVLYIAQIVLSFLREGGDVAVKMADLKVTE